MCFPRDSHGIPMGPPWDFHATCGIIMWFFRGTSDFQRNFQWFHRSVMGILWNFRVTSEFPWNFRHASVGLPRDFHWTSVGLRSSRGSSLAIPWFFHGSCIGRPYSCVLRLERSWDFHWDFDGHSWGLRIHRKSVVLPWNSIGLPRYTVIPADPHVTYN